MSQTAAHLYILRGVFLSQPKDDSGLFTPVHVWLRGGLCGQQLLPQIQTIIWFPETLWWLGLRLLATATLSHRLHRAFIPNETAAAYQRKCSLLS